MLLCDSRGRFLFEVLPDLFPERRLTDVEMTLWGMYYRDKNGKEQL